MYMCMYMYIHVYVYVYLDVYAYVYVCTLPQRSGAVPGGNNLLMFSLSCIVIFRKSSRCKKKTAGLSNDIML